MIMVQTVLAGVFYKSVDRARTRTSAALRDIEEESVKTRLKETSERLIEYIERRNSCEVSVCFALEASSDISPRMYRMQQLFSFLTSAIISADNTATFSALQFSRTTSAVSALTGDFYGFLDKVNYSSPEDDDSINMSAALGTCGLQVRADPTKKGVIVVLGTGRSTVGFEPDSVAEVVLERTSIIPVSTSGYTTPFSRSLGVLGRHVLSIRSLSDFDDAITEIIPAIC